MHCSIKQKNVDKIKDIVSKEICYGTIDLENVYVTINISTYIGGTENVTKSEQPGAKI